tara:strand:- start:1348 stop:2295 length:948 start_codon:yes stop_codon:yes gene_type:complete
MSTKFAIGALVQWYEVDILPEYVDTLLEAIEVYEVDCVLVDLKLATNQELEQSDTPERLLEVVAKFQQQVDRLVGYNVEVNIDESLTTIADYRRDFNNKYCNLVDVLVWGETDLLIPKEEFIVLDHLHKASPTPKYVATFGICKMWDDSWKALEHPEFSIKPFIDNDYDNWWSVKYTMTKEEMYDINSRTESPEVVQLPKLKFNGCGLVLSSEVIRAGVNIPQSVFFVHEDTALMLMIQRVLGNIPQYSIRNILNVHNRNHPKKRMYVSGESGDTMNKRRRSNDWYVKANKYSEENCYNLFNPNYKSKTWKDVWK